MIKALSYILLLASPGAVNGVELKSKTTLDFTYVNETNPLYVSTMSTANWNLYSKSETLDLF